MQKKYRRMLIMLVYILVVTSTIAYSALTSSLQLNAEAKLRTISDIRVTGISLSSANGGTLQYESSYDVNTITSGFVLATTDSSITYKVTVTNNGTIDQTIYDILTQSSNNSGLYYEISGYNVRDVIGFKTVVEFYITYKTTTPSEEPINVVNKFNFKKVYHVTFETKGGTSITDGIKYEGVDLDLSTFTSTKQGYILSGWTDEQDGTTVKYQTNGTYTLDRDLILYAVWEGNPNTSYSVNHYVHDLGTNTYTLDSTDNLTGTTDSTLTLASLKKTIPGFTYVDGYLTGGTTKPTSGATTTTTILADGSRVINLYYRRNYLYVRYHVNGGQMSEQHGSGHTIVGDLIAYSSNNNTDMLRGVYGSKVGAVTSTSTYVIDNTGLHDYNNPTGINIVKTGYIGKSGQEWNTASDGTGTSYNQASDIEYPANGFGGADLTTGDKTVTLYVNWTPVNYEITYDLQGGTVSTANPASYNIETATFTLNNPTLTGYTFTGWTGSNGNTPETTVTIPAGSTGDKEYIANWQVNTYTVTANANGGSIPSTNGWTGTGNTATKSVTYNSPYGTLPEPTRTGYTFLGWNGKNILNKNKSIRPEIRNEESLSAWGYRIFDNSWVQENLVPGATYTLSYTATCISIPEYDTKYSGDLGFRLYDWENGRTIIGLFQNYYISDGETIRYTKTFTIPSDIFDSSSNIGIVGYTNLYKKDGINKASDVVFSNIQLEEGSASTPYEPYYVTSSTNVTQTKNHTLTAKWDPINYEITYDLQGGSVATANPTSYNIESNTITLNNPTMTGYTFLGWTGSNGNTPQATVTIPTGSTGDKAYIANWTANSYTVTADANGGTIPSTTGWTGTGNTATKSVTYDSPYGTLPTPTRDNYIFRGWNGKNLFNSAKGENGYIKSTGELSKTTFNYLSDYIFLNNNHTYKISGNRSFAVIGVAYYDSNKNFISVTNSYGTSNKSINSISDGYIRFWISYDNSTALTSEMISETFNVRLEEGSTVTAYEPYYVTSSTNVTQAKNHTLKAIWDLKESTLLPGQQFNAKIKQLAGNQDATYQTADNNITSIVRSNSLTIMPTDDNIVSTNDSNTPTYAWFDNNDGTIYYYTEALNLYMNTNAYAMFYNFKQITSIDLNTIDTSKTTLMAAMFFESRLLANIDLSNFNTSQVANMDSMFAYNQKLTSLDLSSFDMSKVTNTANMIISMTSLKSLKTPSIYPTDSSKKVVLPKLMVDASGNEYTKLDNTSPTETMLYTPATFLSGQEFNAKIKQLAGDTGATHATVDSNITSIVRANSLPNGFAPTPANVVSTSDSYYPIYAWYDNGTIYYYTEYANPYMNTISTAMFTRLSNVENIDLTSIDTSKVSSFYHMFAYDYNLPTLNLSNFNTDNATSMRYMFTYCSSISNLDLSGFNTHSVTDMYAMFYGCSNIDSIDLSSFDMSKVTNTSNMLDSMTLLKSLKTPDTYPTDSSVKITLPKTLIDASGNEYTELDNTSPTETMLYTPATFLSGQEFNAKIKQLAGNQDATHLTADTNITSIVRSNTLSITPTSDNVVSTNDSYTPIYAWFNNGTLYYYSEATNLYMNKTTNDMFSGIKNVVSIDLSTINTKLSTTMEKLFYNDWKLESIDLTNFDTSNVRSMKSMFYSCVKLTSIDLSNFDTSSLTNVSNMFDFATKIKTLDLSNFDLSLVTNTNRMFAEMSSLESLKTPNTYPSEATMQIPKTLYDPSGNGWSVLDSSSPTETWLHKMVCKRATTLHTETCSQTDPSLYCSGAGYTVGGSKNTSTITYGSLGTNDSTLNGGDAFTCDVNGDGTFNEATERFYYVGDYYNTTAKEFETDTGVLVYYNNVSAGVANNTATSEYDTSGENWHGPVTAITQLPTTSQWTNVRLKNNTRAILNQNSTNTTKGGTLPSDFSYSGYSARLLADQEVEQKCRINNQSTHRNNGLQNCTYLFENTKYSSNSLVQTAWLETTVSSGNNLAFYIESRNVRIDNYYVSSATGGVRPTIEVNKNFLNKKVNAYLITYDTNGGSENTTQTVTVGDSLESLSVPTREGYTFAGWYTEASGGEEVTTATVPTATTTYYAHWTPINYNITYDLDGGEVGTANPSTYNADSNSITLNNPTKTGYTFAGWSGGKNYINPSLMKVGSHIQVDNNGKISATNKTTDNRAWNSSNSDIKLTLPAGTYTLSMIFDKTTSHQYAQYHIYCGTTNIYTSMLNGKTVDTKTFTLSEETEVGIEMKLYEAEIYLQIEENSTSTSYEPYVSNETTLTIPSGSVGNRKYTANWTANTYTVTADANGGSIPTTTGWTGTGNTATKSVTYDSQYGTLPTPTRNGYTFKGWNGKNLFNEEEILMAIPNVSYTDNHYVFLSSNAWSKYGSGDNKIPISNFKHDTQYTFSIYGYNTGEDWTNNLWIYDFYTNGDNSIGRFYIREEGFWKYTSTQGKTIDYIKFWYNNGSTNYISHMQLEEGDTATPYEPYYVTSSTNVTQAKDHTLKAIWEPVDYEITYDLQGGTLSTTNPATYNIETNTFTLNNPTLTGYTFTGWTGSNGNTPEVNVTIPVGSYGDKAYVANFSPIYEPETRIRSLNTIGTSIADDDPDSNLRFIGANPNNYVSFNGQKWRIIGVFDGKLKIIGDSIGKYSWDTSRNTINIGYGINQWGVSGTYTGADLMKLLNPGYSSNTDLKCNNTYSDGNCGTNDDSDYTTGLVNNSLWWNAQSGYCYNWANYSTTACDFTNTGLKTDTARNMIDNATWYLGSNLASDNIYDGRMTASYLYNIERSNNTGKQCQGGNDCNDDVTRTTTWQGKVGLLYPSDYAYATSGGTTHNRNTCLTVSSGYAEDNSVQNWENTYTDCKNNNWIVDTSQWTWFISPRPTISSSYYVFFMYYTSSIRTNLAFAAGSVRPVVYLKSSVKFTTGDGSYNSPFNLIDTE